MIAHHILENLERFVPINGLPEVVLVPRTSPVTNQVSWITSGLLLRLVQVAPFGGTEFYRLAMRGVPVSISPGFFAFEHRRCVRKTLGRSETLERGKPMFVVMRAIVGFAAVGGGSELFAESSGPLFPSEMTQLGKFYGKREGLRLPRLCEDRPAVVAGKLRQRGESFG